MVTLKYIILNLTIDDYHKIVEKITKREKTIYDRPRSLKISSYSNLSEP